MKTRNSYIWVAIGAIVLLTISLFAWNRSPEEVPDTSEVSTSNETEIRSHVLEFGKRLRNVSLTQENEEELYQNMRTYFGEYVSIELINSWVENPETALGKFTSSPYPDRIEIAGLNEKEDGSFEVLGKVIEVTSDSNEMVAEYPVNMTVEKTGDSWKITDVEKGEYLDEVKG